MNDSVVIAAVRHGRIPVGVKPARPPGYRRRPNIRAPEKPDSGFESG